MLPELPIAADENLALHASWASARIRGARVSADAELVLVDSGLPCDTFNLACRSRIGPSDPAQRVRAALDFFRASGHPFSWWLGPGYAPADLPRHLADAGLVPAESELAMAMDLGPPVPDPVAPPGLEVRRVRTPAELEAWAAINAANWTPPDPWVMVFYRQAAEWLLGPDSPQWLYLGLLDGLPIAASELTVGGGVAGLYNVSTLAAHRRRGIGSAMTRRPLQDARQHGIRHAILQASADGAGVYRRVGFFPFGEVIEYKPGGPAPLSSPPGGGM